MTSRMPPACATAVDLHLGGRTDGGQDGLGIGLGIIKVYRTRRTVHVLGTGAANQQARDLCALFTRLSAAEDGANLEQGQVHETARLVAGGGLQQPGQQVGTHMAHLGGDGVFQHRFIGSATEQGRCLLIDEGIGDAFVIPQRSRGAAGDLFAFLRGGQDHFGHTRLRARQGLALQLGQRHDARHFFDQIGLAHDIGAPAGHMGHVALQTEAQLGQDLALLGFRDFHTDQRLDAGSVQLVGPADIGHGTGHDHVRGLAPAQVKDHLRRIIQRLHVIGRINPAFITITRIGVDL